MADNQYPVFEGGQTLTAQGLNQVRGFLHQRDRLVSRLTGFGVACGLNGTVSGSTLTIAPGLALDQRGEPLALAASQSISLPPTASSGTFDFVTTSSIGGFSVVLEATDTVEPTPDCGETDCEGHAELHTRAVALRVVPGRVSGPRFDFTSEPLLQVQPLALSLTSNPSGSFNTLRNAIVNRLTNVPGPPKIATDLISKLQSTSIGTSDLPGVRGYKAGFLNQVLFAALDLLRCETLMAVTCLRTADRPGVVLGWLRQQSGVWEFDCRYRHAWEPPTGLTQALLGGTCADPCGPYRDALEGLISGFAPPDPPPQGGGGGGTVFPGDIVYCPTGTVLVQGICVNVYLPPERIPDRWVDVWEIDPLGPVWNPPVDDRIRLIPNELYGTFEWGFFGEGVLNAAQGLGGSSGSVKDALDTVITDLHATPNVTVMTPAEAVTLEGYEPAVSFSPADRIVLSANTEGMVVAMGRVPAGFTARRMGKDLPEASAKATEALDVAIQQQAGLESVTAEVGGISQQVGGLSQQLGGISQEMGGLSEQVGGLSEQLGGFVTFQETIGTWRGQVEQQLGRMPDLVRNGVDTALGTRLESLQSRVASVEGSISVLSRRPEIVVPGGSVGRGRPLDADVASGIVEFAQTVTTSLGSLVTEDNQRTLGRYIAETTRAAATLEEVAGVGDQVEIADAAVKLLSTMRTAVKSAGVDPALGRQLDTQLNAVRGLLP
jgi:hypothetical protein